MLPEHLRMTKQRQMILEELRKLKTHPTADDMYQILRKKMPRISLGTVYRNLEILSQSGVIQRLDVGGSQKRFDGNAKNHYHVRCIKCSRIDDLEIELNDALEKAAKGATSFKVLRHSLEFMGLCPTCLEA